MNKNMRLLFLLCTNILLFSSCAQTRYVNIETLKPATIVFPDGTENILIVDNSFDSQLYNPMSGQPKTSKLPTKSYRSVLLNMVKGTLIKEKIFNKVDVYPYYPQPLYTYQDNDSIGEYPLTESDIRELCIKTGSDAVISLDYMTIFCQNIGSSLCQTDMAIRLRCYSSEGYEIGNKTDKTASFKRRVTQFNDTDSLSRELSTPINYSAVQLGGTLRSVFVPVWDTQERFYYVTGNADWYITRDYIDGKVKNPAEKSKKLSDKVKWINSTKELEEQFEKDRWKNTAEEWKKLFDKTKNNQKKIKFAFNIALAYEYMDDVDTSAKWINEAFDMLSPNSKSKLAKQVKSYRRTILQRQAEMPLLRRQLNIEDE